MTSDLFLDLKFKKEFTSEFRVIANIISHMTLMSPKSLFIKWKKNSFSMYYLRNMTLNMTSGLGLDIKLQKQHSQQSSETLQISLMTLI